MFSFSVRKDRKVCKIRQRNKGKMFGLCLFDSHVKKIENLSPEKLRDNHLILIKNSKFAEYPEKAQK